MFHTETIGVTLLSDGISKHQGKNASICRQTLDCHLGDVLWEGTGQVAVQTDTNSQSISYRNRGS